MSSTPFLLFCPISLHEKAGTLALLRQFFPPTESQVFQILNSKTESSIKNSSDNLCFLDQQFSLSTLRDIVKECCQLNPTLSILNVSFERAYSSVTNPIHTLKNSQSVSFPPSNLSFLGIADKNVSFCLIIFSFLVNIQWRKEVRVLSNVVFQNVIT